MMLYLDILVFLGGMIVGILTFVWFGDVIVKALVQREE